MIVYLNGSEAELPDGASVSDAVAATGRDPSGRGLAVAVNGTVVPRRAWAEMSLQSSDKVEVLTAVAGG